MYKDTKLSRGSAPRRGALRRRSSGVDVGRLKLDGARLYWRAAGQGHPLILIHGYSASGSWWRANMPALAAHHRVYALDLVGFGRSRGRRPFTLGQTVAYIVAWMDATGIERADVCGHSMGGHVAIKLAQTHPDRVSRLVLADASGLPLDATLPRLAWRGLRGAGHTRFRFAATVVGTSLQAGPRSLYHAARAILTDSVAGTLDAITAPTLIVWGEKDWLIPVHFGLALHRAIPGSQLVVFPDTGHNIMLERPTTFNTVVHRFLSS